MANSAPDMYDTRLLSLSETGGESERDIVNECECL